MTKEERLAQIKNEYISYCDRCPKAYDFTCSGYRAQKCAERKMEIFRNKIKEINDADCGGDHHFPH